MPWVGSSIPITEYVVVPEWPSWPWFCRPSQQAPIQLDEDSCLGCRDLLRARGPRLAVHRLRLPPVHSGGRLSHGCGHLHVFPAKSYFAKSSASSLSPYRLFVPGNRPSTFLWLDLWEFIKGRFPSIGFCDCHGPVRPGLALLEVCFQQRPVRHLASGPRNSVNHGSGMKGEQLFDNVRGNSPNAPRYGNVPSLLSELAII